jgi:hypothetical protein
MYKKQNVFLIKNSTIEIFSYKFYIQHFKILISFNTTLITLSNIYIYIKQFSCPHYKKFLSPQLLGGFQLVFFMELSPFVHTKNIAGTYFASHATSPNSPHGGFQLVFSVELAPFIFNLTANLIELQ